MKFWLAKPHKTYHVRGRAVIQYYCPGSQIIHRTEMRVNEVVKGRTECSAALKATDQTMPKYSFDCEIKDDSYVVSYKSMTVKEIPQDEAMRQIGAPQLPGLKR